MCSDRAASTPAASASGCDRRAQQDVGARFASHPERIAFAVVDVVVDEIREHRRRAAQRLANARRDCTVDRQIVDHRQLGRQPAEQAGLGVLGGIARRKERVRDERRHEQCADRHGEQSADRRLQRRHEEQEHAVGAEEIAIADRAAAARPRERHVEQQHHRRSHAGAPASATATSRDRASRARNSRTAISPGKK